MKEFFKKYYRIILTLLFSLTALILYGSLSFHDNLWYDEEYTLILNQNSILDIIKYVATDFHVPLYPIGLKIVTTIFGATPVVGRFFSIAAIISCFILAFYKIKDLFNLKTAILFSLFLLALPCTYYCSIEIRPYAWPMFLTLAQSVYMISVIKNKDKKSWILYTVFAILSVYSHHIAMIYTVCSSVVFVLYLLKTNRKQLKAFGISILIQFISYIPWLSILKSQYQNLADNFWIEKPVLDVFLQDVKALFSSNEIISYIFIFGLLISMLYIIFKRINRTFSFLLLASVLSTVILCYLISLYITPLIIAKYLVTFIGVFILLVSDFLASFKNKIWIIGIIIILFVNSYIEYQKEIKLINEDELIKLEEHFKNEPYFIHYTEHSLGKFRYLFPEAKHFFTSEINTVLRGYELFGENVIGLKSIEELEQYDVDNIWTVSLYPLDEIKETENSRNYFKNWSKTNEYQFNNTYNFGDFYLNHYIR